MIKSRQIEAFRAVMLTGGMTAACEMIHVTQPAISRLIRDLERHTGLDLFTRRGNVLVPTGAAHALLDKVNSAFTGLSEIEGFARGLRQGRAGKLRIGALPAMVTFLPRFAAGFLGCRPDLDMVLDILPSPMVREGVLNGSLDIGITAAPFHAPRLAQVPLDDFAIVAMPSHHPLAAQPVLGASDLAGQDMVRLTKFHADLRHPVALELAGITFGRTIETSLSTVACTLVVAGGGLAIVDPFGADSFAAQGLTFRRFVPHTRIGTALIQSIDRPLTPAAAEFRAAFLTHVGAYLKTF